MSKVVITLNIDPRDADVIAAVLHSTADQVTAQGIDWLTKTTLRDGDLEPVGTLEVVRSLLL